MNFFFNNQTNNNSNSNNSGQANLATSTNQMTPTIKPGNENIMNRNQNIRHSYHNQLYVPNDDQSNLMHLNLTTSNNTNLNATPSISPLSLNESNTNNPINNNNNNNSNLNAVSPTSSSVLSTNLIQSLHSPNTQVKTKILNKKPSQSSLFNNSMANSEILNQTTQSQTNTNATSSSQLQNDDIEIMKQRSANNNTFLCIKIPEIQLLVSYRATNKDKNIKDLRNVSLLFPLFEIHDKTWTYVDLINALKSHVKKALVSQALKHKLIKVPIEPVNKLINRRRRFNSQQHLTNMEIDEHEKLTILKLFGTKFIEKKSANPSILQNTSNLVPIQIDESLLNQFKIINNNDVSFKPDNEQQQQQQQQQNDEANKTIATTKKTLKTPLLKSTSLLYFKKHFFKNNSNKEIENGTLDNNKIQPNSIDKTDQEK